MHLGIFLFSGDIFSNWVVLDAFMAVAFCSRRTQDLFKPRFALYGLVIILAFFPMFQARSLGWFDSRHTLVFTFVAIGPNGKEFEIEDRFFEPYDLPAVQGNFPYALDQKLATSVFGSTTKFEVFQELERAQTVSAVRAVFEKHGANNFDEGKFIRLKEFTKRFVTQRLTDHSLLTKVFQYLGPPLHIYTFPTDSKLTSSDAVARVELRFKHMFWEGETVHTFGRGTAFSVSIGEGRSP